MDTRTLAAPADQDIAHTFTELARAWKAGRGVSSSTRELAGHPAYQEIIRLGPAVLPFVLRELEREPDHWFIALKAITGLDPVAAGHRGDVRAMSSDWITWGRADGHRW